ncbi:FRG domain-containing protein, partial [Aeromicrobium phoceense]|uniref:FRG domain-containing protein n=2 Tax=Aeromicrobium TaxID=2040 RepID=UPI0028B04B01
RPTSAATRAVDAALADAARSAVLSPDVSETLRLAARRGVARANPTDPALLFALERSRAPEIDAPEDEPKSPEAPHDRTIASVGSFSPDFEGPGSFFAAYELVINSFAELTNSVQALAAARRELTFVWRGQQNAEWGLHSSLYRKLMTHYGLTVAPTSPGEPAVQRFPDEADMLAAELAILDKAVEWRMSDTSALELFARLQHQGGPSRLLDVTRNPLIAAWFAVEAGTADDSDARLFALATGPVLESRDRPTDPPVISEVLAGSRYPFWAYNSPEDRVSAAWGTGSRRRIWIPPAYDARIAAQNAAFLLEGVPMLTKKTMRLFLNPNGRQFSPVDVAASMSVYARPVHPHSRPRPIKANLAPIFSFRIAASAKEEIREMLERTYGFSSSLIYPDIQGMSNRLQTRSDWIGERT